MTASELLSQLRAELFDTAEPYLWSDPELLSYMDQAQVNFCRWGAGIVTTAARFAQVSFAVGENTAKRHPAVMDILKIYTPANIRHASRINPFEQTQPGTPFYLLTDVDDQVYYLDRPTDTAFTVQMSVARKPVLRLADGDDPEIAEEYHQTLLLWAKHRAFDKKDPETYDPQKAGEYEARFRAACLQAKKDKSQDNEPPRAVAYGGL